MQVAPKNASYVFIDVIIMIEITSFQDTFCGKTGRAVYVALLSLMALFVVRIRIVYSV